LVRLINAWGATVATATTSGGGLYRFDGLMPDGVYRLQFTAPTGFVLTGKDVGANDLVDSDADPLTGRTDTFTATGGTFDATRDAGLVGLASISGVAFADLNANGTIDTGEAPLAGRVIFLDANANGGFDDGELSALTGANGAFSFPGLLPGTYRLRQLPVLRWQPTATTGSLTVNLLPGQNRTSVNLGSRPTADPAYPNPVGPEHLLPPLGGPWTLARYDLIASNAKGDSVLLGQDEDGSDLGIFAWRADATGNLIGDKLRVNTYTNGRQYDPAVAIDAAGNFVIVWQSLVQDAGKPGIYARRYASDGTPLGGEFQVNVSNGGSPKSPTVGTDASGNFFVAWVENDESGTGIFARRFDHDGVALGAPFAVNTATTKDQNDPDVAVNSAGDAVLIWESQASASGAFEVHARRFDAAGAPRGGEFAVSDPALDPQAAAGVAINSSGEFVVAWQGSGITGAQVLVARYDAQGVRQGGQFIANQVAGPASIGLADDGTFALVWQATDAYGKGVYTRVFNGSGIADGPAVRVNTIVTDDQTDPDVAMLPDGRYNVVYHGQDLIHHSIVTRVQQFETYGATSSVGGFVWNDSDLDGVFDLGEAGSPNVVVDLLNSSGAIVGSVTTDADGSYRFFNVKAGATFVLRPQLPSGRVATVRDAGTDDTTDSDLNAATGSLAVVAPPVGGFDFDYGIGLVPPASLSGTVYDDRDGNGARGPGEEGLSSWVVYLDLDGDGQPDADEPTTVTDVNGAFAFSPLGPTTYTVRVVPEDLWNLTTPPSVLDVKVGAAQSVVGVAVGLRTGVPDSRHVPTGTPFRTNTFTAGDQFPTAVAVDDVGRFVVVWASATQDGSGFGVYAQRYDAAGAKVGPEFRVNTYTFSDQNTPAVAMAGNGDFVVAWQSIGQDGYSAGVFAQRFNASGAKAGGEFLVNQTTARQEQSPAVAMDDAGRFVIAWEDVSGTTVFVRRYAADGTPLSGEVVLERAVPVPTGRPAIAANAAGEFVVAWPIYQGVFADVSVQKFAADGTALTPVLLANADTVGSQTNVSVAIDNAGRFVVTWYSTQHSNVVPAEARGRFFNAAGVPQGYDVSFGVVQMGYPAAAMDGDGNLVVSWWNTDGTNVGLATRRYNAAGVPQGPMTVANVLTYADSVTIPSVGASRNGNFVVAWTGGVSGNADAMAQRYTIDRPPTAATPSDVTVYRDVQGSTVDLFGVFGDGRDPDSALVYTVTGDTNPALFDSVSIDPATGKLLLDYANGALGTSRLTVSATDGSGLSTSVAFDVTVVPPPPAAQAVFVAGTSWTQAMKDNLQSTGRGDATFGYRVDAGTPSAPALPWSNVNTISVRFAADVVAADQMKLSLVVPGGANYLVTNAVYDASTHTATWALQPGLPGGVLPQGDVAVDIVPAGAAADGTSSLPPSYHFHLTSLGGDADGNRSVDFNDLVRLAQNYNASGKLAVDGDFTGDGIVDFNDLVVLAQHYNISLQAGATATTISSSSSMPSLASILATPTAPVVRVPLKPTPTSPAPRAAAPKAAPKAPSKPPIAGKPVSRAPAPSDATAPKRGLFSSNRITVRKSRSDLFS
jgi:hypothetical protein